MYNDQRKKLVTFIAEKIVESESPDEQRMKEIIIGSCIGAIEGCLSSLYVLGRIDSYYIDGTYQDGIVGAMFGVDEHYTAVTCFDAKTALSDYDYWVKKYDGQHDYIED